MSPLLFPFAPELPTLERESVLRGTNPHICFARPQFPLAYVINFHQAAPFLSHGHFAPTHPLAAIRIDIFPSRTPYFSRVFTFPRAAPPRRRNRGGRRRRRGEGGSIRVHRGISFISIRHGAARRSRARVLVLPRLTGTASHTLHYAVYRHGAGGCT